MVLGAEVHVEGVNFAVFSRDAESMILCLFESSSDGTAFFEYRLDPRLNKTGDIWHVLVVGIEAGTFYLWRAAGPFLPAMGHRFNRHKALIDPYAKAITGDFSWDLDKAKAYDAASSELDLSFSAEDDAAFMPKCVVVDDDFDWSLLGYAYPQKYGGPEVPVFTGIDKRPTPEGFVQFGAELATSGAVAMYHVVGFTPEAPTVEDAFGGNSIKERITITDSDLDQVRNQFAGEPGPIEFAMFGCPHLTIRQVGEIAALADGEHFAVDTWILVSSLTLELAERMGYLSVIHRAGGHVIPDTCMDVPGCWDTYYNRPGVTESPKCAFYSQVYGQRYAVRPLTQAVRAALTGEVVK